MNDKGDTLLRALEKNLDTFFKMHSKDAPEPGLHTRFMEEVERVLIKKTLAYSDNVQLKASNILGINRNTLRKKIQKLKINVDK